MEGMKIVSHQRNRFKGFGCPEKIKRGLYKYFDCYDFIGNKIPLMELELDHIIPYCISEDSSLKNLQLLTLKQHRIKTKKDKKILKQLKEENYIETLTPNFLILIKSKGEIIKEYLRLSILSKMSR